MSDATQPSLLFPTILNIVGFSSLIATGLAHWLSSRSDRKKWINDNKKLEWRELIDALDEGIEQMRYAFYPVNGVFTVDDGNKVTAGILRGSRAITGRIFIAGALKKHGLVDKWHELRQYASSASHPASEGQTGKSTPVGFNLKVHHFRDELLRIAQEDLGVN